MLQANNQLRQRVNNYVLPLRIITTRVREGDFFTNYYEVNIEFCFNHIQIGMLSVANGKNAGVIALESDNSTAEEGLSSESGTSGSSCCANGSSPDDDSADDTLSLKLG